MLGCEGASFLSSIILLLTSVHGRDDSNKSLKLKIHSQPAGSSQDVPGFLKLTEGSTLNLTCEAAGRSRSRDEDRDEVRLSWYLPNNFVQPQPRFEQIGGKWSSTLIISPVIESDTGDYECWARQRTSSGKEVKNILKVLIEPRRGNCQPGQYQCEGGDSQKQYCIATRYRCDSRMDCPAGDDESPVFCGPEPCKGKIVCPELDFRCIDPTEYCCDPQTEPETCKFLYPCCESVIEFSIRSRLAAQWAHLPASEGEEVRSDIAYLHSTVYTIIGCSLAFIIIVLGLGVAICRLHLLRKSQRSGGVRGGGRAHPPITLHDLDIYFSERSDLNPGNNDIQHIGITYNINHGVQIMGRGVGQPPPYSTSPRGRVGRGPPPPYISQENIAQPLLNTEDDNNNGDINGNSDMVDNNVRPEAERGERTGSPPPRYPGLQPHYSSTDTDTE